MFEIVYEDAAAKVLGRMPRNTADLIRRKINILAEDPFGRTLSVKKLKGREGYRLRVGDWRVLYTIERQLVTIRIVSVGPRGGIYQ
jgi:mRNA interferase RelE/StbE